MKHLTSILLLVLAFTAVACHDDVYDSLPQPIATFVSKYYPDPSIGNYTDSGKGYTVMIRNGATLYFDRNYQWTSINGNGQPLPEMMLFDQLPEKLYNYLTEENWIGRILTISRDDKEYVATTPSYKYIYTIATSEITGEVLSKPR